VGPGDLEFDAPVLFFLRSCYAFVGNVLGGNVFFSDLESFGDKLRAKFALPGSASPEDQLKPLVAELLTAAGIAYGHTVETRTESHLSEHKARPDIAVYVGGLICGYIELKAPGLGADAPRLKGEHNKKQWEKLKGLPNLIYTDGRQWALYRTGERPDGQPIIRLHDDPTDKGKAAVTQDDADNLARLFRDFLGWTPSVPHNPSSLANYLAPLSRFLRSEVETALEDTGSAVKLLANEWRQFFFPESDNARFADAYSERFRGDERGDEVPAGAAKIVKGVSDSPAEYPETYGFDPDTKEITVGTGRFGPVASEVWEFEVSGLKVVQSWLGYRMKTRAGKKSSPLDLIRPVRWTARMSEELLELLWVLEATLAMEPDLEKQLDRIVAEPCFTAVELPQPTEDERKAPGPAASAVGGLLGLMGVEADGEGGDDHLEDIED